MTGLEGSKVNIDQPARYFWWANDSRSYQDVGEWLFGRSDITSIDHRPWLYPLLLGLTRTLFGNGAEKCNVGELIPDVAGKRRIDLSQSAKTGRAPRFSRGFGAGFFFSHPSPLLLTFHGMTETLNILLISAFCWVLTSKLKHRIYYAVLLIALATVTKPIYLLFLILLALYVVIQDKQTSRWRQVGWVALLLLPIWIQLLLSFIAVGKPTISTIGSYTFKNYLVADVYLRTEGTEWRDTMKLIEGWDFRQQLSYLWEHQMMTLLTVRSHLIDSNLLTGSFFTLGAGNRMKEFAVNMNVFAVYLHLLMLPLVVYYLLSPKYLDNKETIALLYICFLLQFLTSGISTGQDDRLLITALPLWIVAYILVLRGMNVNQGE